MAASTNYLQCGTDGKHGWDYHVNVSMLCYLQGFNNGYSFVLRAEVKENGKFDDIEYNFSKNGRDVRILLQVKYKKQEAVKINYNMLVGNIKEKQGLSKKEKKCHLKKYFESYKDMKNLDPKDTKNWDPKDVFCIYTNIDFDTDLMNICEEVNGNEVVNIKELFSGNVCNSIKCPKFYRLKYSDEIKNNLGITSDAESLKLKEFLGKLIFALNQPNTKEIEEIIKKELSKKYNLTSSSDIFEKMLAEFSEFISYPEGNFKSENYAETFFNEVKQMLKVNNLLGIYQPASEQCLVNGNFFNNVSSLNTILNTPETLIHVTSKSTLLSFIKVVQFCKNEMDKKEFDFGFAAIDLKSLLILDTQSKNSFQFLASYCLVVKCVQLNEEDLQCAETQLKDLIEGICQSKLKKKLILISNTDDKLCNALLSKRTFKHIEDISQFRDFSKLGQDHILEKQFFFQGNEVQMSKLAMRIVGNFPEENFEKLLSKSLSIGGKSLEDEPSYYIERNVMEYLKFDRAIFTNASDNDVFVFSKMKKDEISQMCNEIPIYQIHEVEEVESQAYVIIMPDEDDEKAFQIIQQKFKGKHIYWFQKSGEGLYKKFPPTNESNEFPDGVKILVGKPGIGKSSFMNKNMHIVKSKHPQLWCMLIKLHDHCKYIDNLKFENNDQNLDIANEFLISTEFGDNKAMELEKAVLRDFIREGQVALFFDGFDEICPDYKDKVIKLITCLKNIKHMWISTRLHYQKDLEEIANACFCLLPFSKADQIHFLTAYWSSTFNKMHDSNVENKIMEYAERLIDNFSKNNSNGSMELVGIPLQTRLLADIYEDKCNNYISVQEFDGTDVVDLHKMYMMFVEKMIERNFVEKRKADIKIPVVKCAAAKACQDIFMKYGKLAFEILFPAENLQQDINKTPKSQQDICNKTPESLNEENDLCIGIVQKSNGKVDFIHRTYAEYFLAHFLVQILKQGERDERFTFVIQFLKKEFLNVNNDTIRLFMDHMLAEKSPIHAAILKGKLDQAKDIVYATPICIFNVDLLERLPLHLAFAYNCEDFYEILIKKAYEYADGVSRINKRDTLGYFPLSYVMTHDDDDDDADYMVMQFLRLCPKLNDLFSTVSSCIRISSQRGKDSLDWCLNQTFNSIDEFDEFCISNLNSTNILNTKNYVFEEIVFILQYSSYEVRYEMLLALDCHLIKMILECHSLKAMKYLKTLTYSAKKEIKLKLKSKICNLDEFKEYFKTSVRDIDLPILKILTDILTEEYNEGFWKSVQYTDIIKILQSSINKPQCYLAKNVFDIRKKDLESNCSEIFKIAINHKHKNCDFKASVLAWDVTKLELDRLIRENLMSPVLEDIFRIACYKIDFEMLEKFSNGLENKDAKILWENVEYIEVLETALQQEKQGLVEKVLDIFKECLVDVLNKALDSDCPKFLEFLDKKNILHVKEGIINSWDHLKAVNKKHLHMLNILLNVSQVEAKMLWKCEDFQCILNLALEANNHDLVKKIFEVNKSEIQSHEHDLIKTLLNCRSGFCEFRLYMLLGNNILQFPLMKRVLERHKCEIQSHDHDLIKALLNCGSGFCEIRMSRLLNNGILGYPLIRKVFDLPEYEENFKYLVKHCKHFEEVNFLQILIGDEQLKLFLDKVKYIELVTVLIKDAHNCKENNFVTLLKILFNNLDETEFELIFIHLIRKHGFEVCIDTVEFIGIEKATTFCKNMNVIDLFISIKCRNLYTIKTSFKVIWSHISNIFFTNSVKERNFEMACEIATFVGIEKAKRFWEKVDFIDVLKTVLSKRNFYTSDTLLDVIKSDFVSGKYQTIEVFIDPKFVNDSTANNLFNYILKEINLSKVTDWVCNSTEFPNFISYSIKNLKFYNIIVCLKHFGVEKLKFFFKDFNYRPLFIRAIQYIPDDCINENLNPNEINDSCKGEYALEFLQFVEHFLHHDACAFEDYVVQNISVEALNWIRKQTELGEIRNRISESQKIRDCFDKALKDGHFRMLFEITEFIGDERARDFWKVKYLETFESALINYIDLAEVLLRLFQNEIKLSKMSSKSNFKKAFSNNPTKFIRMLSCVTNSQMKQEIWSNIDYVNEYQVALKNRLPHVLHALAECSKDEKMEMLKQFTLKEIDYLVCKEEFHLERTCEFRSRDHGSKSKIRFLTGLKKFSNSF